MSTAAPDLERASAEEVVSYAVERFHPKLAMACSFQKEETVLLDMLLAAEPGARVFTIDTGVLFEETYATWRAFEDRWGVRIEVVEARADDGSAWTAQRCCTTSGAKVDALRRALGGLDAWITGVRREQASTRADSPKVGWDERNGLWKANPLADWTERDVWRYIAERDLPYNELHDRGYESIGCAPCTQAGAGREGRWAGSDQTECGLHG